MTLLIDQILSGSYDIGYPVTETNIGDEQQFQNMVEDLLLGARHAVVFEIQNVFDYFDAHEQVLWRVDRDFPNVAPVFPATWFEYRRFGQRIGWIVLADRLGEESEARWGVQAYMFRDGDYPKIAAGPSPIIAFQVSEDGRCIAPSDPTRSAVQFLGFKGGDARRFMQLIFPVMLAGSFLHCKNVLVTDNEGKHASRQERRAAERRNDPPLVTYKTLQIEPMKKVLATEGDIAKNGLAKALHICRGHFAEYGGESGKGKLFGKLEGRFYIPAHVRGSAEKGVVHKRYNVNAPKGDAA